MSERINLVVEQSQKERWENHVDENTHFSSVSDLIRTSVEKELNSEQGQTGTNTEINSKLVEIEEKVDESVVSKLDEISLQINSIREAQEEEDIEDFAKTVFRSLETAPSEDNVEEAVGTKAGLGATTLYELSQELNSTPKQIAEAIEWLRERGFPVVSYELGGNLHYFEEV